MICNFVFYNRDMNVVVRVVAVLGIMGVVEGLNGTRDAFVH